MRNVLVTGASGFVGGRLVRALMERLPAGTPLVAWGHQPDFDLMTLGAQWQKVEITDPAAVDASIGDIRPRLVFHLAALSSVGQSHEAGAETYASNLLGTNNIARSLVSHVPDAALVFASTGEVYGSAFLGGAVTETSPMRPLNPYARSKLACEFVLQDMLAQTCPVIALRLLNHTGPGQDERFVVPSFAAQVARIEAGHMPPTLSVGNLSAERDFLDVDDVIDAYVKTLDLVGSAPGFRVFNVASGHPRSIASIVERLRVQSRLPFNVEQDPARMRAADIATTLSDASSFRAATGWAPRRDFDDTIARVLDHWREQVRR